MPSSGRNSDAGAPVEQALARFDKGPGEPHILDETGEAGEAVDSAYELGYSVERPNSDLKARKALVVEDDPDVRAISATIIRGLGFETLVAPDGEAALAIVESNDDIVLLFSDVVMPGRLNGVALAEASMHLIPGLKVVLTSGYNDEMFAKPGGAKFPLIRKPYRSKDLSETIHQLIDMD